MKNKFLITLSLVASTAFASTTVYQSFQSSYLSNSGAVTDKDPVVQVGFDTYESMTDELSFHVGAFANYSPNPIDGWYSKDKFFNETDIFLGLAYSTDSHWLGFDYEYWHYPHIIGKDLDTQNVLHAFYQYYGTFTYTLSAYYYIDDGYNYLVDINPRIGYKYKVNDDLSLSATVGTYYRFKDIDHINGFNSGNFKLSLDYKCVSVFYQKWFQFDSRLDSDYNDDLANDCYGISWSLKF